MASRIPLRPHLLHQPLTTTTRSFSSTPNTSASPLFMLSQLSNSRETTHFAHLTKLSRVEHSPSLALIKDSEVNPWPLPSPPPGAPVPMTSAFAKSEMKRRRRGGGYVDARTLAVGKAVLAEQASIHRNLRQSLYRASSRRLQDLLTITELRVQVAKAEGESRKAAALVALAVGLATAALTWRLWPDRAAYDGLGKIRGASGKGLIAQGATQAETGAAATVPESLSATASAPAAAAAAVMGEPAVVNVPSVPSVVPPAAVREPMSRASWWKGLFWKQS